MRCLPDQSGLRIDVDGKEHSLEFDRVYGPMATQEEVRLLGDTLLIVYSQQEGMAGGLSCLDALVSPTTHRVPNRALCISAQPCCLVEAVLLRCLDHLTEVCHVWNGRLHAAALASVPGSLELIMLWRPGCGCCPSLVLRPTWCLVPLVDSRTSPTPPCLCL